MADRNPSTHTLDLNTASVNDYVEDSGTSILNQSLSAFAFSCWVYPTVVEFGTHGLFGNYNGSAGNRILVRHPSKDLNFYLRLSGSLLGPTAITNCFAAANTWYGVVIRWDGSNFRAWCSGTASTNTTSSGGTWAGSTNKFAYGYRGSSQATPNAHYRDGAAWLNFTPSDSQCSAISTGDIHPLALAPSHYWPMDHTSGSPIDMVGGVNLTMGSAAAFNTDVTPRRYIPLPIGPSLVTRDAGAAPGTTPKGVFGLPFNGPFAGALA